LETFRTGKIYRARVLRAFQAAPLADIGFAQVDIRRALRKGFPEVLTRFRPVGGGESAAVATGNDGQQTDELRNNRRWVCEQCDVLPEVRQETMITVNCPARPLSGPTLSDMAKIGS
jgi:hypothetical protein